MENFVNATINSIYTSIIGQIPENFIPFIMLGLYTLIIAVFSIFMWKFYRFLARKNILELNLKQYNKTEHPFWNKFLASCFFLLEYIIILPVIVFFWFSIFSVFILLLSEIESLNQILLISAAVIAASRLLAYYNTDLAEEVVGVFPICLLVIFITEPGFFSVEKLIERFLEIPSLLNNIFIYLIFIFALEIIMRVFFTIVDLFYGVEEEEEETEK